MIKAVSWNIAKRVKPWRELVRMAKVEDVDLAFLQEASRLPGDLAHLVEYEDAVFWDRQLYDRWPLVVKLSDRINVEHFRQTPPISDLGDNDIGVSGIGTIAAAKVIPVDSPKEAFVAVSMYGRWLKPQPSTKSGWIYADASAHRIVSDLSAFIGHEDPATHRILAAGDLNILYRYGDAGSAYWAGRYETVFTRMKALGLSFIGPQAPNGRQACPWPTELPDDSKNVPTYFPAGQTPAKASRQLDYAFASRGFHERVSVKAMNEVNEWGPSDHSRLIIEVETSAGSGAGFGATQKGRL
ncbi:MAG: hypothetical protein OXU79_00245 [Gemmatimonadota bacterium]|nr:hypothetical protein [Gemmatimonadota bacterium]